MSFSRDSFTIFDVDYLRQEITHVLRSFCTYILLVALTLQSFYHSIMTVEYQLHLTEYISKCINRDKPQLQCNGQCVFMEKIKEKEQKEAKKNLVAYEYSALYVHNDYHIITMYPPNEEINESQFMPYSIDYLFNYSTSIFRPPIRYSIPLGVS